MNDIIKFIKLFHSPLAEVQGTFKGGECYWFAKILYDRFSPQYYDTNIYYNPIENHFATKIQGTLYDVGGKINDKEKKYQWIKWENFIATDPLESARIFRDCVFKIQPEEWEKLPSRFKDDPWFLEPFRRSSGC